MKEISRAALGVKPSSTFAVDSLAKRMRADGIDVIGFGMGEPDFETPQNIKQAAIRAIEGGKTRYTPSSGMDGLKKAVAERIFADCGVEYEPSQIVAASGAKHSIFAAVSALINPGDEVIIPSPYWVTYPEIVKMAGGAPVIARTEESEGFKLTPERLTAVLTPKAKLLILNNPSNPTGMLYNRDELTRLAEVCVKHDLYILADEIYSKIVYDGREFVSIVSLGEEIRARTILINGVSKAYAMTGWRVGYSASSNELARVMSNFLSHSTSAPSTISQFAAVEALTGSQESVELMRRAFEERRNYAVERVNSIPGISCIKPDGAFYIMMNLKEQFGKTIGGRVINSGDDFALSLLERGRVAVVSCSGFGDPGFVRMSYAAAMDDIKEGLRRVEEFLEVG
ncbi:MAG: pyridoxal phosphate-dependent aminotransferase [Oscillospiraceae bacterium]|nr:pyridoxal phosphate-dependent aminotransferase [Oscillospiraceae bacterium]